MKFYNDRNIFFFIENWIIQKIMAFYLTYDISMIY